MEQSTTSGDRGATDSQSDTAAEQSGDDNVNATRNNCLNAGGLVATNTVNHGNNDPSVIDEISLLSDTDDDEDGDYECGGDVRSDDTTDEDDSAEEDSSDGALAPTNHGLRQCMIASSSSEESEADDNKKCHICLNKFRTQDLGNPESCDHTFCLDCIQTWSRRVNTCPIDRSVFRVILARRANSTTVYRKIQVNDTWVEEETESDLTFCRVCLRPDREHRMLLCDGCDSGYHLECLQPPLADIPANEWFCPVCIQHLENRDIYNEQNAPPSVANDTIADQSDSDHHSISSLGDRGGRHIPRTRLFERVRADIAQSRLRRNTMQVSENSTTEIVVSPPGTSLTSSQPRKRKASSKPTQSRKKKRRKLKKAPKRSTSSKRKKRKKARKPKNNKRLLPAYTLTPKTRLADKLGLVPPRVGSSIPQQRGVSTRSLEMQRSDIGARSLSIQGHGLEPVPSLVQLPSSCHSSASRYSQSSVNSRLPLLRPAPVLAEFNSRCFREGAFVAVICRDSRKRKPIQSFRVAQIESIRNNYNLSVDYLELSNTRDPSVWRWPTVSCKGETSMSAVHLLNEPYIYNTCSQCFLYFPDIAVLMHL